MQILRMTHGTVLPGSWDQFEAALEEARQKVGPIPGLVSRSLVRNLGNPDEGYSMSLWENLQALEHYEGSELRKTITPMLTPFFTGDFRSDHCKVRYWDDPA